MRSQRELLEATTPNSDGQEALPALDVNANELALVYRARGMSTEDAEAHAADILAGRRSMPQPSGREHEAVGSAFGAAFSSFCFFASGAIVPVLPYLFGAQGIGAVVIAAVLVGIALLVTGSIVGLLSGKSPIKRALRQLGIGFGAAGATYLLGLLFGVSAG